MTSIAGTGFSDARPPVFVLGSHKSGSSMLRSLLDSHSELAVLPKEGHFFQNAGYWVDYALGRSWPVTYDSDSLAGSFRDYLENEQQNGHRYSDAPGFSGYDIDRFISYFKKQRWQSMREIFETYWAAQYYSLFDTELPKNLRVVDKSTAYAEYAVLLKAEFPRAGFIHIVRNPYATLVAVRKTRAQGRFPNMARIASGIYNSYYYLIKNPLSIENYLVIRYEDLVLDTRAVMAQVADFLGIKFENALLDPTMLGKRWRGNSTSNQLFNGVSSAPLDNWKVDIHDYEIHLTNKLAGPIFDRFGYNKLSAKFSPRRRVRGEGLGVYVKNRVLLSQW